MITPADQKFLKQLVGTATFSRGRGYAVRHAVRTRSWDDDGTRVVGEVQGTAAESYKVTATVSRSAGKRLSGVHARCTCPVGINCKHAVALLLSGGDHPAEAPGLASPTRPDVGRSPAARPVLKLVETTRGEVVKRSSLPDAAPAQREAVKRSSPPDAAPAQWEASLRSLVPDDGPGVDTENAPGTAEDAEVGVQFELVNLSLSQGQHRSSPVEPVWRIRIRPLVPGTNGRWVRSGISWNSLDYRLGHWRAGRVVLGERASLLHELQALARSGRSASYSYSDEPLWLDGVNSRRIWDLLAEAGEVGIPLLGAGRDPAPLTVLRAAASIAVDLAEGESGLSAQPLVAAGEHRVPLHSSLLVGKPAHGIAWWVQPPLSNRQPPLLLAPLAGPVDDSVVALLRTGRIEVPERDRDRFFRSFYPGLRRRLEVVSSDGSVELPELPEPSLVLQLQYEAGHRVSLAWCRDDGRRLGLWDTRWRRPQASPDQASPDQKALQAVAEAAARSPEVLPALFETAPLGRRLMERAELEGMQAVRFVESLLPVLRKIPNLTIEEHGTVADYREAPAAPVVAFNGTESNDGDWLDLAVAITVGGEEVPFAELFSALASEQSHLILPSGTYFSLRQPELAELAKLIAEARMLADTTGDRIRLSRFQASLWEDLCRLGVVNAQANEWQASIRALAGEDGIEDELPPAGLKASLRPYQQTGFGWLSFLLRHSLGGILADDMGLGKTLQALALVCHARESGRTEQPFLVVAPTSVVGNWASECEKFTPGLRVVAVTETSRRRKVALADTIGDAAIVVTSYSLFRIDFDEYQSQGWAGLFLDEAQFVKNHRSHAYRCARMLPARFKVAMTGTPMENNLMELWSLLSVTSPGLFPSPDRFAEYYRAPIEKGSDGEKLAQLRRRIRPLVLRRTKEQVVKELPPKQEQVLELDLSPRHRKIYQTYLHRERQKVLGLLGDVSRNRFQIFRSLNLLRQASLDASLVEPKHAGIPSAKLDAMMDMLTDVVADGHKVLVFSQFTRFLSLARERIRAAGIDHCYLDGRTRNRAAAIARFQGGDAPVFLVSLKAGGFGLNLTEADYCILLDPWWNPATEAQAVDRVHRIGQTRQVMIYRLISNETIEEKVMALKAKKAALFSNVVDAGAFGDGSLTASDIRGLLV